MGSLISQGPTRHRRPPTSTTRWPRAPGAHRGKARPDLGPFFYEPTILRMSRRAWRVRRRDLRPGRGALPLRTSRTRPSSGPTTAAYGLNFSVGPTTREAGATAVAARLQCGTVNVNEAYAAAWGSVDAPMGGMKASPAWAAVTAAEGILKYTESQPSRSSGCAGRVPMFGLSEETIRAKVHDRRASARCRRAGRRQVGEHARSKNSHYDVLVVGSGFGGSVTALRLTEKGYTVGVLEAGRRFADDELREDTAGMSRKFLWAPALGLLRHPAHPSAAATA